MHKLSHGQKIDILNALADLARKVRDGDAIGVHIGVLLKNEHSMEAIGVGYFNWDFLTHYANTIGKTMMAKEFDEVRKEAFDRMLDRIAEEAWSMKEKEGATVN